MKLSNLSLADLSLITPSEECCWLNACLGADNQFPWDMTGALSGLSLIPMTKKWLAELVHQSLPLFKQLIAVLTVSDAKKIDILRKLLNVSFFESPEVPSRMGPIGGNPATMGSSAKEIGPRACSPWCLPGSTTTPPPSTTRKATTSSAGTPGGRSTGSCAGLKKSSFFFEVLIKFFDRGILLTICSK